MLNGRAGTTPAIQDTIQAAAVSGKGSGQMQAYPHQKSMVGGHVVGNGEGLTSMSPSLRPANVILMQRDQNPGSLELPKPLPWGFGKWFQKQVFGAQVADSARLLKLDPLAHRHDLQCTMNGSGLTTVHASIPASLHGSGFIERRPFIEAALPTKTIAVPGPRPTKAPAENLLSVPKPCMGEKKDAGAPAIRRPFSGA
jgi:hypothetical protein